MKETELLDQRILALEQAVSGLMERLDIIREDVITIKTKLTNGLPGKAETCRAHQETLVSLDRRLRPLERIYWQALAIAALVAFVFNVVGPMVHRWLGQR